MACVKCPWDITTHLHSVWNSPVCHGAWMETYYNSMSPGHELVPVHFMHDMSLGHIDTFIFCIKTPRMSLCLDGNWLYFHVPGTWISSCSRHAWSNPPPPVCPWNMNYSLFMACVKYSWDISTDLHSEWNPPYVMASGWRLTIFPCTRWMI